MIRHPFLLHSAQASLRTVPACEASSASRCKVPPGAEPNCSLAYSHSGSLVLTSAIPSSSSSSFVLKAILELDTDRRIELRRKEVQLDAPGSQPCYVLSYSAPP